MTSILFVELLIRHLYEHVIIHFMRSASFKLPGDSVDLTWLLLSVGLLQAIHSFYLSVCQNLRRVIYVYHLLFGHLVLQMLILVHELKCVGVGRQLRLKILRKFLGLYLFGTAWVGVGVLEGWVVELCCLYLKFDIIRRVHGLSKPILTVERVDSLRA